MIRKDYKCGLRAFVIPKKGYQKTYAMFATNFGSIDDKFIHPETNETIEVPDGVAHFLEHKLFSMKDGSAMDKFAEMGSSSNAYTSFTHTSYLFSFSSSTETYFFPNIKENNTLTISFIIRIIKSFSSVKYIFHLHNYRFSNNTSRKLFIICIVFLFLMSRTQAKK